LKISALSAAIASINFGHTTHVCQKIPPQKKKKKKKKTIAVTNYDYNANTTLLLVERSIPVDFDHSYRWRVPQNMSYYCCFPYRQNNLFFIQVAEFVFFMSQEMPLGRPYWDE